MSHKINYCINKDILSGNIYFNNNLVDEFSFKYPDLKSMSKEDIDTLIIDRFNFNEQIYQIETDLKISSEEAIEYYNNNAPTYNSLTNY